MILLTANEIITLHRKLTAKSGGSAGLRDLGLLQSAVDSVYAGFGDIELYPTAAEKAARLAYSLISNHAFVDGNKRIGVFALLVTARLNNIPLSVTDSDLITLGLKTAAGEWKYSDVLNWVRSNQVGQ